MEARIKFFLGILGFGILGLLAVAKAFFSKNLTWFFPAIFCVVLMWIVMMIGIKKIQNGEC